MNRIKLTRITLAMTLFTAIWHYEIYTRPFRALSQAGFFQPAIVAGNLVSILFILSPILAIYFYYKNSNACYFWLALFPCVAFIFGVAPIPFASYFYTSNMPLNAVFVAVIDIAFVVLCWFLYRANKAFNSQATPAGAPLNSTL